MTDIEMTAEQQSRRKALLDKISTWRKTMGTGGVSRETINDVDLTLTDLLGDLESAEDQARDAAAKSDALGVWQVELTNGTVHNFVASRAMPGGPSFLTGVAPNMLEFVNDLPSGRSPVVLAVRADQVVSYRRLGDFGRDEGQIQPATFACTPFAGPAHPKASDKVNVVTKPHPLIPHS